MRINHIIFCMALAPGAYADPVYTSMEQITSKMNAWNGAHTDELVSLWGVPSREHQLSNGGKVVEYDRTIEYKLAPQQPPRVSGRSQWETYLANIGRRNYSSVTSRACIVQFNVDPSGIITKWLWKNKECAKWPE